MKIVLSSARADSPSYQMYSASMARINDLRTTATLEIANDPRAVDYAAYDVALFMGFDQCARLARRQNPSLRIGVVEPRAAQEHEFAEVDFIIANCIESKDYFARFNRRTMLYYVYPQVPARKPCPIEKKRLVLGYHGNLVHLREMFPRITDAIRLLAHEKPLELWAMYNMGKTGRWTAPSRRDVGFPIVDIQFSEDNYARYLAHVDIGIVPQLKPVRRNRLLWYLLGALDKKYGENDEDYLLRFKETTNPGRHLVFAQYGIPVVSDMTPSACALIEDEYDGFVAYHTGGWLRALRMLAGSEALRRDVGERLRAKFEHRMAVNVLNRKLLAFIAERFAGTPGVQ